MNAEQRNALRQAIDHAKRERLGMHRLSAKDCVGCGTSHELYTAGCRPCMDRRRRKRIREAEASDENFMTERRFRLRNGLCTRCGVPIGDTNPDCFTCLDRARKRLIAHRAAA